MSSSSSNSACYRNGRNHGMKPIPLQSLHLTTPRSHPHLTSSLPNSSDPHWIFQTFSAPKNTPCTTRSSSVFSAFCLRLNMGGYRPAPLQATFRRFCQRSMFHENRALKSLIISLCSAAKQLWTYVERCPTISCSKSMAVEGHTC